MEVNQKYLREPFRNIKGDFQKELKIFPSPDKEKNIVISHCWEYRMGANVCLFHLTDNKMKIIEDFTPHTTYGKIKWAEDSNTVAITIGESQKGILIMHIELMEFSLVKTNCIDFEIEKGILKLIIPQDQIDLLNSDKLYGGGISELPRIKYIKPADITIEIASLIYYQKNQLKHIFELNKEEKINLAPINSGFWEFIGKLPQNTYDGFNGREFEVYQLEAFARFGDQQSMKWLDEIKSMTDKRYDIGWPVSYYLGKREREI